MKNLLTNAKSFIIFCGFKENSQSESKLMFLLNYRFNSRIVVVVVVVVMGERKECKNQERAVKIRNTSRKLFPLRQRSNSKYVTLILFLDPSPLSHFL